MDLAVKTGGKTTMGAEIDISYEARRRKRVLLRVFLATKKGKKVSVY